MKIITGCLLAIFITQVQAAVKKNIQTNCSTSECLASFRSSILQKGPKASSELIQIIGDKNTTDRTRWLSVFLLGQVNGKKAIPLIAKYTEHPHWVIRLAALKTLLHLNDQKEFPTWSKRLTDPSLLVRYQALENVRTLKMIHAGPMVYKMLFDPVNYLQVKQGKNIIKKRGDLVRDIIAALGDLKYLAAKDKLLKLSQNKRYDDLFDTIDGSLQMITGKNSVGKNIADKRAFWKTQIKNNTVIH